MNESICDELIDKKATTIFLEVNCDTFFLVKRALAQGGTTVALRPDVVAFTLRMIPPYLV